MKLKVRFDKSFQTIELDITETEELWVSLSIEEDYENQEEKEKLIQAKFDEEFNKKEESNYRRETRRHTLLSTFEWEDAQFFDSGVDLPHDTSEALRVQKMLDQLTERQQYLIFKCFVEGWSYTDLAKLEGKSESAIRKAVNRAKRKLEKLLD